MFAFIQKKLELKIILTLTFVIACVIGISTYIDIRNLRLDAIHTSERTLNAFAGAIKGSVTASMKKGHHDDVRQILQDVNRRYVVDRVIIYNGQGQLIDGAEKMSLQAALPLLPPAIIDGINTQDMSVVSEQKGMRSISYYSSIENSPECFRCHGSAARLNGILRVDFSLRQLDDLIAARRTREILWSVLLIVLMTGLLAALLRIMVYRPLRELRDAMATVQEGVLPVALSTRGRDELADLKQGFVNMLNRIDELHRTNLEKEKELAHNEEIIRFRSELQNMFDAMPDGVLLVDTSMRIVQSNPRIHTLLPHLSVSDGQITENCPFQSVRDAMAQGRVIASQCSISLPDRQTTYLHSICAPLFEGGRVKYVVQVVRDMTERVKTERELEERTAELIAANKLLAQIAITDSLTQVHNRRSFDAILHKEVKRFSRHRYSHLSLMLIDIDHFKALNDRFGHLAGDMVLREVATVLKENVRETDTIARYGGEEFAIVMPDTPLDGAGFLAETLRKKIEARVLYGHEASIRTTISAGVAGYTAGTQQDLVNTADQALYEAKNSGRNRVVVRRI